MEDGTSHDLLLALAGRVDDDLLSWARELVALGEDARAVELLTASLVAARAVLPEPVHAALVAAARAARTDLGPAAALPQPRSEAGTEHRFTAPEGHDPVAGALLDIPTRPLAGCSVLLARRLTPAGSAPGPVPHPVVLVRIHSRSRPADVLAYQLSAALERAGTPASVEALPTDGPVFPYHAAALDTAVELRNDADDARPWRPGPAPRAGQENTPRNAGHDNHRDLDDAHRDSDRYADLDAHHDVDRDTDTDRDTDRDTDLDTDTDTDTDPDLDLDTDRDTDRDVERNTDRDTGSDPGNGNEHDVAEDTLQDQATTVLPTAVAARPELPGTEFERHSLAPDPQPSERPTDQQVHPLAEPAATERALRTAPLPEPELPPDEFGTDEGPGRRSTAPLPRHPVEEQDPEPEPEPADGHGFAEAAEATTSRIRPAPRRVPEREPDRRTAVTGRLPVEVDNVRRLDGRDTRRDDRVPHDEPRDRWEGGESPEAEDDDGSGEPLSPHPLAAPRRLPMLAEPRKPPRPKPAPVAGPTPLPAPETRPRPDLTPIARVSVPDPIPLVRRDGPTPVPRPMPATEPHPTVRTEDDRDDEPPGERHEEPSARPPRPAATRPERTETAAMDALSDPLNGPLDQPLLAPLLDPTTHDDPLGPRSWRPGTGAEPDRGVDDEWSDEWVTGRWAMAPSALDETSDDRDEQHTNGYREGDRDRRDDRAIGADADGDGTGEPRVHDEERPPPRPAPLHRYLHTPAGEDDTTQTHPDDARDADARFDDGIADDHDDTDRSGDYRSDDYRNDDGERYDAADRHGDRERNNDRERHDAAEHQDDDRHDAPAARDGADGAGEPPREEHERRAESLARLSDADRQLLARLQADLADGRPRTGRRTGFAGRAGSAGSRRSTPPDLAG